MSISSHAFQNALAELVSGHLRPATADDSIAGVQPQVVVEPVNEQEVAATLTFANHENLKVCVRGGGTQLKMGKPPSACNLVLSTKHLNQIVEHEPHDMTVTVQAGLCLSALQAHLHTARQWLALDPALDASATIGGLISTNVSGPRRLRFGGVRDQIIGIRVVLPDGTIAKGGGKVVKNVAGYDLPKLYTGALGTLGVIVSANFRLYPLRASSQTVLLSASSPTPLCELVVRIIASTLEPTALDVFSPTATNDAYTLAARFETEPEAVRDQITTLLTLTGSQATHTHTLQDEQEAQFWQQANEREALTQDTSESLQLKVSLLPTDIAAWLTALQQLAQKQAVTTAWRAHAGHGLIMVRLAGEESALATAVTQLRQAALAQQGNLVVTQVSPTLARTIDIWGPIPTFDVMRRLKTRFDPNTIMNPGRFVGGI